MDIPIFSYLFVIGRIAAARVLGKKALAYTVVGLSDDDNADNAEQSADEPCFSAVGAYAFPEPPSTSSDKMIGEGYCDALSARRGDNFVPFGYRDTRLTARTNPATGAIGVVQYGGGYIDLRWDRDRQGTFVTLSAPRLDAGGNVTSSHYLSMDPADANNAVILAHRQGHAVTFTKEGKVVVSSPDGHQTIVVGNDGIDVGGKMNFLGGLVVGNAPEAQGVVLSPPLVNLLTTLLSSLATAFSTPAAPGSPLAPTWATAVVPALEALLSQLETQGTATTLKASPQ